MSGAEIVLGVCLVAWLAFISWLFFFSGHRDETPVERETTDTDKENIEL
jgi:hypothetical protein